ncbi:dUTP diphosphatase [bacterium]|nr:dUTP diphosphatase [bacterium]
MNIKIEKISELAIIPQRATEGSSGYDLHTIEPFTIESNEKKLIKLGFKMEIPFGYEAQIRPRSGLALKHGVTVLNTPGTIDSDYRGEVGVILINLGKNSVSFGLHERVAQMVFQKVESVLFVEAECNETERSDGGFGHTGRK